ncbi:MAG: LPXTG cell wall anchor domain-containing protein [Acidobacteriota bacterium]|nr:LPXTG cell wall anchor domain-containing protein [Acidobacteriota bacterium]
MRKFQSTLVAAAAVLLIAGAMSAQNADQNTGGPTKNTLRLRLAEPREGAQISGSSIRVAVDYNRTAFGEGQGTKFGNSNYPQPRFDVYLDNSLKETLKGGEKNVAEILNVPPGAHKIAVVAKNVSGEIIDRAEVTVTNVAGTAAAEATTSAQTTSGSSYSSSSNATAAAPPSDSTSTTTDSSRSSMSTSTTTAPDTTAPSTTSRSDTLPRTASNAPAAALLGATLLAAGLYVSRRRV